MLRSDAKNGRRLLLIEPPFYRLFKDTYALESYPLSLGYLAAVASRDTNWKVQAYNADFGPNSEVMQVRYLATEGYAHYLQSLEAGNKACASALRVWNEVRSAIADFRPSVVGITAKSQNFASARIVAKIAKEVDPSILVIVGGPHPSMVREKILDQCQEIDACVVGEGEVTLLEVLRAIEEGNALDSIHGLCFRKDGMGVANPPRELIQDLDSLPFPHQLASEVLKDYPLYPATAFRAVFATRGCPYKCSFCGSRQVWTRKVRHRSGANVAKEVRSLQKLGVRSIRFEDDIFGVDRNSILHLCSALIENCPGIKWSCELHVRSVQEDLLRQMKAAGCESIQLGIESGDNRVLKEVGKTITIDEAHAACRLIKKAGIEPQAFFMVGFPQESLESLQRTAEAIRTISADVVAYSIFTPYPGTELYELCRNQGMIRDEDVSLYNHQSPANYFCPSIPRETFRAVASDIEKAVDRRNNWSRLRRVFSMRMVRRLQEAGPRAMLAKGMSLLRSQWRAIRP